MQIAGSHCHTCDQPIVLATDGKFCRSCGKFAHLDCEQSVSCPACGNLFDYYHPSKRDIVVEAFDPREKRSFNSVGPMLTALLAFLMLLLWFYLATLA